MILRPYQAELASWVPDAWTRLLDAGKRPSVVVQLPTGGGKTPIQAAIVEACPPPLRCAVLAPGLDLCRQLRARVGCEVHLTTTLASWYKRGRRLPDLDVVLVDEARCITSPGVAPVIEEYLRRGARLALFDATPETAQGQGLGQWADALRQGPPVRELINAGWLVPTRVFSCDPGRGLARSPVDVWIEVARYGKILERGERGDTWQGLPRGRRRRRTLVFCRDKAHARATVAEFAVKGVPAAYIGEDTPIAERQRLLGWTAEDGVFRPGALARGEVWALACAQILRQGIDIPEIEMILVGRAADSEPLARQIIGRGMRTWIEGGKVDLFLVDLVGGLVEKHGLPDDHREWTLDGTACRPAGSEPLAPLVKCRNCHSWGRGGKCLFCGFALPPPPPPPVLARDLVEVRQAEPEAVKRERLYRFVREAFGRSMGKQLQEHAWIFEIASQARVVRSALDQDVRAMLRPAAERSAWAGIKRYEATQGQKLPGREALRVIREVAKET